MTTRISNDKARAIARLLAEPKQTEATKSAKMYAEAMRQAYLDTVPPAIVSMAKKFPKFFCTSDTLYLMLTPGSGKSDSLHLETEVVVYGDSYSSRFRPTSVVKRKTAKLRAKYLQDETNYKKLVAEIANALIGLRTIKRILAQFPEAAKHIDATIVPTTPVSDNALIELRKKIKG